MLKVGVNSYIDLIYADKYIEDMYSADNEISIMWGKLTELQKTSFLIRSALELESIIYVGKQKYETQTMQFPRIHRNKQQIRILDDTDIPDYIKMAQIENVLFMLPLSSNNGSKQRLQNQKDGVQSFTLDGFSESYGNTGKNTIHRLTNPDVEIYISKWINGGFTVV